MESLLFFVAIYLIVLGSEYFVIKNRNEQRRTSMIRRILKRIAQVIREEYEFVKFRFWLKSRAVRYKT